MTAYISASRIAQWNRCKLEYRYEHLDGFPDPPHVLTAAGTAVHEALAEVGRVATSRKVAMIPTHEAVALVRSSRPEVLRDARALMAEVAEQLDFTHALPEAIEEPFEVELAPGRVARGRKDRVQREDSWNTVTIDDWKTGRTLGGPLEDDPQSLVYLMAERDLYEGVPPRIVFRRVNLRLGFTTPGLMWSEEIDQRARSLCLTTLDEIDREREWKPSPSVACRRCPYLDRCPAWKAPATLPPDLSLSLDDMVTFAHAFRSAAKVYARRADALEAQLANIAAMNGPFVAGGRPVELVTAKGRRSGSVSPDVVSRAAEVALPGDPTRLAPGAIAVTSWGKVRDRLKGLKKGARAAVWAALDVIAPRNPKQKLVIGPLAGEDAEEDENEADESAEEAA